MNRKQKILLGLLAALAVALAYRLTNPFEQKTIGQLIYARATKVSSTKAAADSPRQSHVRLDLLRSPPKENVTIHRDLFKPPTSNKPPADDKKTTLRRPVPAPRPKGAKEEIKDQLKRFKTFGSYRHGDQAYLFLQRGKQVLVVTTGDLIDGKFKITDVDEKSVTILTKGLSEPLKINFDEL